MKPISLIMFLAAMLISACAPTIKHVRYNPEILAFEGTTYSDPSQTDDGGWFVLYDPDTRKVVRDSVQIEGINLHLQPSLRHFFYGASDKPGHGSLSNQYRAGKQYFEGVWALEAGRFGEAQNYLEKALRIDPGLQYDSDLHYLRAVCYQGKGIRDSAAAALDDFTAHSEGLVPLSFYLDSLGSNDTYRSLVLMSPDSLALSLYRGHIATYFNGPAVPPRWYVGHIRRYPLLSFMFGVPGPQIGIGYIPSPKYELFYSQNSNQQKREKWISAGYQAFRSSDNRVGLTVHGTIINGTYNYDENIEVEFVNLGPKIEIGLFPDPSIGLFGGFQYFRYNESNPFETMTDDGIYQTWHFNEIYGGVTVFLNEFLGITGLWERNGGFRLGAYLVGWHLFR